MFYQVSIRQKKIFSLGSIHEKEKTHKNVLVFFSLGSINVKRHFFIPASSFHRPLFSAHISSSCLLFLHIFLQPPSIILHLSHFLLLFLCLLSLSIALLSFFIHSLTKGKEERGYSSLQPSVFIFLSLSILFFFFIYVSSHYFQPNKLLFSQQAGDKQPFPILFICPREC